MGRTVDMLVIGKRRGSMVIAYFSFYACLVDDSVDLVGRDSRLRCPCCNIQHFSAHLTHLPHAFLLLFVEYLDLMSTNEDL